MREHFRPEFLNRIDEIVEFHELDARADRARSSSSSSSACATRLAERGIALELTDAAKEALAEAGWDPTYGARPLKRAIQRLVENPLALRLLEGEFARRRHDPRRRRRRASSSSSAAGNRAVTRV